MTFATALMPLMSLASLRDFMLGTDLASTIDAVQTAQQATVPAHSDVPFDEDLTEVLALLARFRAEQVWETQRTRRSQSDRTQ